METPLILICDDARPIAVVLSHFLQAEGCRTLVAAGALEAVSLARRSLPSLILMDIRLPGLDGATATVLMHDTAEMAEVPILLMSAMPEDEIRTLAAESGAKGYVLKPFTRQSLLETVRKHLPASA